ncbi:restriction endonuclease subunit S [Flavobacterium ammonificans]|uniref:Type I restriction endonuclease subunit S n=1 Tax=Flavobacterium ammonificans TaxID=1751056 RepID=A0ABM7V294_9FLAO|nr:restriction endonuclease subunit S [Flavobacterium ammonificans]BDB53073.1 type I restriction endonuclease subunit S [Flavobacterium ammonificans]
MPNNWKTYKLSEVTEYIGRGISPKYTDNLNIRVVNQRCIRDNKIIYETCRYHEIEKKSISDVKYLIKHDVLVNSTGVGTLGRVAQFKSDFKDITVDSHVSIVRPVEDYADEFFGYAIIEKQALIESLGEGSTGQTELSRTRLGEDVNICLPESKKEREEIASILSAIDDKIENNLAINKTLEEIAMALYKHWFVDFGPFQDGEFVDSELGRIPKGWEVKNLGSIVSVLGGYAFKSACFQDSGVKVLKIKNINNNIVDINNCTCISEEISKTINPKFRVTKGDFLIAMTGAEVGKVGAVPDYNQELWLNQRVGKLVDKELKNASILIGKLLQTNDFYKVMQGLAYGSAQPNISTSDIESIKIALPIDKSILNEIIDEFVNYHEIIIQNLTENQTLTQLRDTLLPKLISGEMRLKEFVSSDK